MEDHFSYVRLVRSVLKAVVAVSSPELSEGDWDRVRAAIFRALRPFEEARVAVRDALASLFQAPEEVPS